MHPYKKNPPDWSKDEILNEMELFTSSEVIWVKSLHHSNPLEFLSSQIILKRTFSKQKK